LGDLKRDYELGRLIEFTCADRLQPFINISIIS
jgi:hypothetical protein